MDNFSLALTYDDVLLVPQYSEINSREDVNLETHITKSIKLKFPVIAINMDTVTGVEMAIAMYKYGGISFYPRFLTPELQAKEVKQVLDQNALTIPAVGVKEIDLERVRLFAEMGIPAVTIDVAHGHMKKSLDFVRKIKKEYKDLEVIAGVIATYEGARDLFEAGADAVRVGVGPGTICTTRKVTGFGVPQITATIEAYRAAKEYGRIVITDGGTKLSGDMVKALAAGANAVVTGSQLAGTDEAPGEIKEVNEKKYKAYNASTSATEKNKQFHKFHIDKTQDYVKYVEGTESFVPYKGSVNDILSVIEKGIRSGLSYSGANNIEEFHEKAKFIRVTPISVSENGAHGVVLNI
ncbi:MAG: IMP dehydrogenase [bacterium]|nr:IMP dehydrogenase [bacterium]